MTTDNRTNEATEAQGAAPQAESEYVYCPEHGDLLAGNRSYRCANAPTGHEYAAPVLPSSTVDEDALRNVVRVAKNDWLRRCGQPGHVEDIDVWITRAVAEWIKVQNEQ